MDYALFDFILTEQFYKPRDMIEFFRDKFPKKTKVKAEAHVNGFNDRLLDLGILDQSRKGILCLK